MKKLLITTLTVFTLLILVPQVSAHVVVKPNQAGVGAFQTFTIGVPNEKENPTVALRLVVPEGLKYVTPNVKPGWTITEKKTGEGETTTVTEIEWSQGSIPSGQRDDFLFSAQVPATETSIAWKAYQTYKDGTVVSWDQPAQSMQNLTDAQKEENEKKGLGPASETKIINDLTPKTAATNGTPPVESKKVKVAFFLSILAILISGTALGLELNRKKNSIH